MSFKEINTSKFEQIWILVPCFNESKVIMQTISELSKYFQNILVADDGSTDTFDSKSLNVGFYNIL